MFNLTSVQLRNFRPIIDATFTPLTEGITGLSGRNGIGKSAFLDGVLWALFGELPRGVTQAELRNSRAEVSDECFVEVIFTHGGQNVRVRRELRGKNATAVLNTWLDDREQTITSIKVGEQWIRERLAIDAKGFTTAFLVKQKDLDSLVNAVPSERRATIERLSGIERMSAALKTSREHANVMRKQAETLPGSVEEVDAVQAQVEDLERSLADAEEDVAIASADAQELAEKVTLHEGTVTSYTEQETAYRNALAEVQQKEALVATAKSRLADAVTRVVRASENAPEDAEDGFYARAQEAYAAATKELGKAQERRSDIIATGREIAARIAANVDSRDRARADAEGITARISQAEESLSSGLSVSEEDAQAAEKLVDDTTENVSALSARISTLKSLIGDLEESLSALSKAHSNECPTCHSVLEEPHLLIDKFAKNLADMETEKSEKESELSTARRTLLIQKKSLKDVEAKLRQRESTMKELEDSLRPSLATAEESIATFQAKIDSDETERQSLRDDLEAVDLATPQAAVEEATEALRKAETSQRALRELQEATDDRNTRQKAVEDAEHAYDDAEEGLSYLQYDEAALESARTALNEARALHSAARDELSEARNAETRLQERLAAEKRSLEAAITRYDDKKDALANAEQAVAVSEVLDEFRKSQIARIAPELSETATGLISAMTNGKYVEVLLDETFTPTVVNSDGEKRTSAWLSGGELSVVALCLRIAIGDLLTGGNAGLLWLDEVLTAQDADRRASLIDTLRTLNDRQIVMVNHTQGAEDVVDRTITLSEDENGTVLHTNA